MRIWFNRGFSLAPIAAAMRASYPDLSVFASVGQGQFPQNGPSATWIEPDGPDADYIAWVRDMISEHRIDILIPTSRRHAVADAALGCRVEMPAAISTLDLLDDKFAFAASLADQPYRLHTRLIRSSAALANAISDFGTDRRGAATPCIKPRRGVNGHGFWRLMPDRPMSHLNHPEGRKIYDRLYVATLAAAEQAGTFEDLVLMEYLPGPEVSVDILAHCGTMVNAAARTKLPGGVQRIETRHALVSVAEELVARFGLHGVVNAQFRRGHDDCWRLLEINARPAGGIIYSEAVGCGLLADWAALLTGKKSPTRVSRPYIDTKIRLTTTIDRIAA